MVFRSAAGCATRFPCGYYRRLFQVYKVEIDCTVPFPCLLKDLPESKDVVTRGSPLAEASLLFMNVLLQGGSHALNDLAEHFACEPQECYAPPVVTIR